MGNFFRLASIDEIKRIDTEEGDDWIDVRANLSKKTMDNIIRLLPDSITSQRQDDEGNVTVNIGDATDMAYALFKALVVDWSLVDANNAKVACSFDNYLALDPAPAQWIDGKLYEHFAALQTSAAERGKASTSRKG